MRLFFIGALVAISVSPASSGSWQLRQCSNIAPEILAIGEKLNALIDQATELTLSENIDIKFINDASGSSMIIDDELAKSVKSIHDMCAAIAENE